MGWAMCKTENGKPVESDQGKDVYTTSNYVFAQLLDYYGMTKESKDVYKHMDRVVFDYANSMITPDNLRAELEKEAGESRPGTPLHRRRLSPAGGGLDASGHEPHQGPAGQDQIQDHRVAGPDAVLPRSAEG